MSLRKLFLMLGVAIALGLLGGAEAFAEELEQESLFTLLNYGGAIGWFTIILNFIGYGLAIEHFINIRKDVLMPPEVVKQVEDLFEEGEYEEAMTLCEGQPNYFTRVMAAALPMVGTGFDNIEKAAERANDEEATKLFAKIGHVNFIGNLAPLLGLLGTVWGMMWTFSTLAKSATPPTPAQMASGIQQAIVTTVIGLCVNIPLASIFYFFRFKVISLTGEIASQWRTLVERFRE
jgi:biopolymer transport protein ExbB